MQTGRRLMCCIPTMPNGDLCDRDGYELFKVIIRAADGERTHYVFCSERHRQYFIQSHRSLGNLPPGMRSLLH